MKAPHDRPEPLGADPGAGCGIVGKAGVKGGGEGHAVRLAPAARAPADRAFGRDMDDLGLKRGKHFAHPEARRHGQPDRGIAGHGHSHEALGCDQFDFIAAPVEFGDSRAECADDAVDLRIPGVGCDGDSHACELQGLVLCGGVGCLACPIDDVHFAAGFFDQRGAAFDPVAVVVIGDIADLADFGGVDMAADYAIEPAFLRLAGDCIFEVADIFDRILDLAASYAPRATNRASSAAAARH